MLHTAIATDTDRLVDPARNPRSIPSQTAPRYVRETAPLSNVRVGTELPEFYPRSWPAYTDCLLPLNPSLFLTIE